MPSTNKLSIFAFAALMLGATLYMTVRIMDGIDFYTFAQAAAFFSPYIFIFFLMIKPLWIALTVGLIPLAGTQFLPIPLFDRITPSYVMIIMIFLLVLGKKIISKDRTSVFDTLESRLMLFFGAVVIGWFVYQRPGALRAGSEMGGINNAIRYTLAILGFWGISVFTKEEFNIKTTLRSLLILAIATWGIIFLQLLSGGRNITLYLFERASWMLYPLLLAMIFQGELTGKIKNVIPRYAVIFIFMVMAGLSAFRSRILFFFAITLAVSFFYGKARRTFLTVSVVLAIAIFLVVSISGRVPVRLVRPLSLVMPTLTFDPGEARQLGVSSETGWVDSFRGDLFKMGWERIRHRPLLGYGSGVELNELVARYMQRDVAMRSREMLAYAAAMHNIPMSMAIHYGIPVSVAFMIAYGLLMKKFVEGVRMLTNTDLKVFCVSLCGLIIGSTGQALMNGGPIDVLILSVLMGLVNGLIRRPEWPSLVEHRIVAQIASHESND